VIGTTSSGHFLDMTLNTGRHRRNHFASFVFVGAALATVACAKPEPGDESAEAGDTAGASETGELEGDTADDSAACDLWEGDATYPGDCDCASPGEECVQGCLEPDGMTTCDDVCAQLGETCVENGCDGGTYTGGNTCPAPGEYENATPFACDQPVPMGEGTEDFPYGVSCCCTRSG
jgi:hypothetical protein